jgi:hypothetical protein
VSFAIPLEVTATDPPSNRVRCLGLNLQLHASPVGSLAYLITIDGNGLHSYRGEPHAFGKIYPPACPADQSPVAVVYLNPSQTVIPQGSIEVFN